MIPQLEFPSAEGDLAIDPCAICGATVEDQQYVYPSGMQGMSADTDLCLECACHIWRAVKEVYPDGFRLLAWELLGKYSITAEVIRKSGILGVFSASQQNGPGASSAKPKCSHDRLDEDGICRQCGADRRGI